MEGGEGGGGNKELGGEGGKKREEGEAWKRKRNRHPLFERVDVRGIKKGREKIWSKKRPPLPCFPCLEIGGGGGGTPKGGKRGEKAGV